jgi:hypothetical protein
VALLADFRMSEPKSRKVNCLASPANNIVLLILLFSGRACQEVWAELSLGHPASTWKAMMAIRSELVIESVIADL